MIVTDHAPHSAEEKARPMAQAPSGITGLETSLALGILFIGGAGIYYADGSYEAYEQGIRQNFTGWCREAWNRKHRRIW